MENLGWFSMHRKYEFEPVFDDAELWRTWCWIYMKASHKQHSLMVGKQLVTLMPGELIWGKRAVAKKLNIHESKAYRHLKLLEKMGLVETKPNHNFTVVKVIVWDIEQNYSGSNRTTNEPQTNHSGTINEPQMNTNNNVNHVNTVKREKKDSQYDLSLSGPVPLPKSAADVREYCIQMGYTKVDPEYFFEYYEKRGWMTGGKTIENWHALVKWWNDHEKETAADDPVQEQPEEDYDYLKWFYDATEQYDKLAELEEKHKQEQDEWRVKAAR